MSITRLTSDRLSKASLLCAVCLPLLGQQPNPNDRLIALGRLWATIEYFHPYLASRNVDWDKALIDNLPAIRSAKDPQAYGDAVQSMLDALHDPATYVDRQTAPANPGLRWEQTKGTLVVSEVENSGNPSSGLADVIQKSEAVVFDLRMPDNKSSDYLSEAIDSVLSNEAAFAGDRRWVHHGLPSVTGLNPDLFYSAFSTSGSVHLLRPTTKHFTFIVGEGNTLPKAALALWRTGRASVSAESSHFRIGGTQQVTIDLGEGVKAIVRLSEPEFADGTSFGDPNGKPVSLAPVPVAPRDNAYADTPFPAPEYRILAAYKIWAAFRNFFAYRDLMDEDLDAVFAQYLPKLLDTADARAYHLAVAEMVTHVDDTNSAAHSTVLDDYFGKAPVPIRLALVEKRPIVTDVFADARDADIHVGDVVVSVDGEDLIARIKREAQFVSASTQQSLRQQVMSRVLNGADGSTAVLSVRDEEGTVKEVHLKRSMAYCQTVRGQRSGDPVRLLAGGIGYADLDRLLPDQVESMFDTFKNAKAIVFDMRGTPHVTPEAIASRLTDKTDVAAAIVTGPLALTPDVPGKEKLTDTASFFVVQTFTPSPKPHFNGKTVMLTDERTSGDGERMGLFLEAANNTAFVGDASAGAVTAMTDFAVPGGITITLSGIDVRHGNAGKLQRLGLQPAVSVPASVKAIRAGRDEMLEKAIAYLSQ